MESLVKLSNDLATERTTARALLEQCFENIANPAGEGERAFLSVNHDKARAQADAMDSLRKRGLQPSAWAGIPISVKDLYDVRGEVTSAGSLVLKDNPPAVVDAPTIARLRAAGLVFVGRTNMVEFAYAGIGMNPHFGTPRIPFDRQTGRIPGGSTSGGAVSVADGMAAAALGSDTGGSCRIPAAFCGITGYKPTASRVPLTGLTPLSFSLDSAGPLSNSVDCCAVLDAVMAGEPARENAPVNPAHIHLAIPQTLMMDGVDAEVGAAFEAAVGRLSDAGITIEKIPFDELAELPHINRFGGFAASESYAWHKQMLADHMDAYDPRVGGRIIKGAQQTAADYIELCQQRQRIIRQAAQTTARFDAFIAPTVAIVPPTIASLADDEAYFSTNMMTLRNTSVGNFLDRCSISLPCHEAEAAPVGFMLTGRHGDDHHLLRVAKTVETLIRAAL
ncbi:MAG: amidase [Rhodospirillales bacterium]|nr:amidase [Rhodospirillales bacterium]